MTTELKVYAIVEMDENDNCLSVYNGSEWINDANHVNLYGKSELLFARQLAGKLQQSTGNEVRFLSINLSFPFAIKAPESLPVTGNETLPSATVE